MKLSVCIITKNEEAVISRCLSCVKSFADQIVVADTGSTDGTVGVARRFTGEVYSFEWIDDFSAARNFAFSKASGDYLMWLDADDVIYPADCKKIRSLVDGKPFGAAYLPYAVAFEGDAPTVMYLRERIFSRAENHSFSGAVHEAVTPTGKTVICPALIRHKKVGEGDKTRNLNIYKKLIARGISLNEREKFYYARELAANGDYLTAANIFYLFLSGGGWEQNKAEACINLYHCLTCLGNKEGAYAALLQSFLHGEPRADACCILGEYFVNSNPAAAIGWYKRALSCKPNLRSGGFVNLDFFGFIPYMQLCMLYGKLGNLKKARRYNLLAGKIKPNHPAYLHNLTYFSNLNEVT